MKKITLFLSFAISIVSLQAQDYLINFTGTGASFTVGTVTVENLTQGKSIILSGTEVLHLAKTIAGLDPILDQNNTLLIYPNPTKDNTTIEFVSTATGKVNIELFDISGKGVVTEQATLPIGTNYFQISGLGSGIFTVRISSQSYSYIGKIVSNGTLGSKVKISYNGSSENPITAKKLKSANNEIVMQYTTGDRLKITGTFGNYSTMVMDVPTQSKTINFNFITCTDYDGNNYPVVQIGTQLWMTENLKTTKYRNGDSISNVTDSVQWRNQTTGAYCNYKNDERNSTTYGRLYNWYSLKDSRNVCPTGWHVPNDAEWLTLTTFLGTSNAGNKLKETGTTHWQSGNAGTNESGFSALPGGRRDYNASWGYLGSWGYWWSMTEYNTDNANYLYMTYGRTDVSKSYTNKTLIGFSVRCIKD